MRNFKSKEKRPEGKAVIVKVAKPRNSIKPPKLTDMKEFGITRIDNGVYSVSPVNSTKELDEKFIIDYLIKNGYVKWVQFYNRYEVYFNRNKQLIKQTNG